MTALREFQDRHSQPPGVVQLRSLRQSVPCVQVPNRVPGFSIVNAVACSHAAPSIELRAKRRSIDGIISACEFVGIGQAPTDSGSRSARRRGKACRAFDSVIALWGVSCCGEYLPVELCRRLRALTVLSAISPFRVSEFLRRPSSIGRRIGRRNSPALPASRLAPVTDGAPRMRAGGLSRRRPISSRSSARCVKSTPSAARYSNSSPSISFERPA